MLLVSQRLDSPRMDPLLPGLKRKLTGAVDGSPLLNGVSNSSMTQGSAKRLCLEDVTLAMDPTFPQPPFPSGTGMGNQGNGLEGNRLTSNNGLSSPYSMPPKASPGSTPGGAGGSGSMVSTFNPNGNSATPSVEQELQDILDELTKNPDPSLPELDIEKILGNKTDEQTNSSGNFVHPEGSGTPKRSPQRPSHLEAHLTQSPGFPQVGSPQMGASPAGAPYSLSHSSKPVPSPLSASPLSSSSSQGQNQARSPMLSAALSRSSSNWHEVSRAHQLQHLASNSKHLSTNSGGPPPAQSGLSSLGQQGSSWAGPSPPYRPGDKLPNSSPHQQPFSPASSIQSPQSSLISSITPAPSAGPSPPYGPEKLSSPALAQPPFSPQSTLLPGSTASGSSGSTVQSSQANYLSNIPPTSGSTRPSPPYRSDKQHPSPAGPGPTQPGPQPSTQGRCFTSQNGQTPNMSSQLYKAITSSQPSSNNLKLLMQPSQTKPVHLQNKSTPGNIGPETFSFTNTKPLRHYDPEPQASKMGSVSLGGFRNGSMQPTPPASAAGQAHLLQQRMQRAMQADGMVPHCGEDQNVGMVPHLQDPSAGPRPVQASNYNTLMLKNQLIRKQLQQQQEKQRQMDQMNGTQMSDCQQVAPFQGRTIPPECSGYPMGTPQQPKSSMVSLSGPLPSNRMSLSSGSLSQVGHPGPYMGGSVSKQPFYHPSQDLGISMHPNQSMMGVGGPPRQPMHSGHVARPRMAGPTMPGGPTMPTNHLRQALHPGSTLPPRMMFPSQQQQSQSALWQNQQGTHPHMESLNHQHSFPSGAPPPGCGAPQFPGRPGMAGISANFPGARPPPNQIAPGLMNRQGQKLPSGQTLPSMPQQNHRMRGALSSLEVMKGHGAPAMMHPCHGMAPPSYPVASMSKHTPAQGYNPGHNPGHKMPPYDYLSQPQSNGTMIVGPQGSAGGGRGEVDFIDTLVGSNDDWLNNLNMIDEYLEQNS